MEKIDSKKLLPSWAPRVRQKDIKKLYESNARGIYDEELIDEVGYGLLVRCLSFIEAVEAVKGKVKCPFCGKFIFHHGRKEDIMECGCGWKLTWGEYFETIQHQQLSGAEYVLDQLRKFTDAFISARSAEEKMLIIDRLIHGFHWDLKKNLPTRPVAINLIQGRLNEVVAFLDNLTYNEKSTSNLCSEHRLWNKNIAINQEWYTPDESEIDSTNTEKREDK